MTEYRKYPVSTKGMPPGIPYIISNEAAERFSFYGMKAALAIFLANYLGVLGGQQPQRRLKRRPMFRGSTLQFI